MSLKSDLAHTLSILAFAVPVLAAAGNKNPCNVECVQQQIAKALAALPTLSPDLTAADWDALCPAGQSLANLSGCQPDCTGKENSACDKILIATNLLPMFALPAPNNNSIVAFSFTPGLVTSNGPLLTAPTSPGAFARCVATNVLGGLQPQVINFDGGTGGSSGPNNITYTSTTVILLQTSSPAILQLNNKIYTDDGSYFALTNTYYVICSGFTVTSKLAYPASVAGVTASWT